MNLWKGHRWATIGVATGLVAVVIALVAYAALKRPGDKSCPAPCTITATTPAPVSGLTDWPMYGLNPERTRYLDAPDVKPPFSIRWRFKGNHLLEYSPVLVGNQLFGVNNNGLAFAVKASTGKARWKQQIAHLNASSPTYSDHVDLRLQSRAWTGRRVGAGRRARDLEAPAARPDGVLAARRRQQGDRRL